MGEAEQLEQLEQLKEALRDAAAHLVGAASAYRAHAMRHRSVGRAKPDPFFTTRAADFEKAADRAVDATSKLCFQSKGNSDV